MYQITVSILIRFIEADASKTDKFKSNFFLQFNLRVGQPKTRILSSTFVLNS